MHERFKYKTGEELILKAKEMGFDLPFSRDLTALFRPLNVGGITVPNRFAIQPMEGYDSEGDGSPSVHSLRRYKRYATGGSGLIWFEAVSVNHEGRSNPRQLWINKKNSDNYSRLVEDVRKTASAAVKDTYLVMQLTHSGRYSKPDGKSRPLAAAPNPILDNTEPYILSDDDLKRIMDRFVESARLAHMAGFNAVDLKTCHGYLIIDLLSSRTRQNSIFGGAEFPRRSRFLLETFDRIRDEVPGIDVTVRLNITDLYKGGFGVDESGNPDFTEPLLLAGQLSQRGIRLMNISMGSPYYNPHVTRPFNNPLPGVKPPDEHPLEGVYRMIEGTELFQKEFKGVAMVGSAYSYLRQYSPNVGAAVIEKGAASFIGFGRGAFAYPDLPLDLMRNGRAFPEKVCTACSGCTRLIRNLRPGGCVLRDKEIYGSELKKLIADGK